MHRKVLFFFQISDENTSGCLLSAKVRDVSAPDSTEGTKWTFIVVSYHQSSLIDGLYICIKKKRTRRSTFCRLRFISFETCFYFFIFGLKPVFFFLFDMQFKEDGTISSTNYNPVFIIKYDSVYKLPTARSKMIKILIYRRSRDLSPTSCISTISAFGIHHRRVSQPWEDFYKYIIDICFVFFNLKLC